MTRDRLFLHGTQIIETTMAVDRSKPREDWSRVRSPGCAARRRRQGKRQNIIVTYEPCAYAIDGKIVAHPEIVSSLRKRMAGSVERFIDEQFFSAMRGHKTREWERKND